MESRSYDVTTDNVQFKTTPESIDMTDTQQHYRSAELYVVLVMLSIFSILGVIGNFMVLYVYLRKRERLVTSHFITVLGVVDMFTCLVIIPLTIYFEYVEKAISNDFLCKFYHFLITSMIPFSVLIMVAIAVDRYFSICHPFLKGLTLTRAKIVTIILALFAAALGIIVSCMYGVYFETRAPRQSDFNSHPSGNLSSVTVQVNANETYYSNGEDTVVVNIGVCTVNSLIFGYSFIKVYHKCYTALYLICLLIMIISYALIYHTVRRYRAKRLKQQSTRLLTLNDQDMNSSTVTGRKVNGETVHQSCHVKTNEKTENSDDFVDPGDYPAQAETDTQYSRPNDIQRGKERMRMANLHTAAMLFVVTVVFVIAYMPAFVMSMIHRINIVAFYLYFANNMANPIIYGFMDKNFRALALKY